MNVRSEAQFWNWFVTNEEELYRHTSQDENAREELFDRLLIELHKVDVNLAFEFSSPQPIREFIISAEGNRESFPAVVRLQESFPGLPRWELIAFRPRRAPISIIRMGDLSLSSKDFLCVLLTRGTDVGLRLYIPGFQESDFRFKTIAYLFLEQALGEFDVETKISLLKFLPLEEKTDFKQIPFEDLPVHFDRLYNRLHDLSGKPS